ncbi:helix-turn-helix domain-containing protein [Micromonospora sp. CPCC 206061]|uniref:helix-turn-helix domain-containing protein n=1 Tax=Micromonospora sp. CPCC 206061 TaxID=3122410 RepID=UPI002FEE7808
MASATGHGHPRDVPDQRVEPLLAERGVHLSREQVYRLVTQAPQRLNMDVFAALCDVLGCGPQDLVEVVAAPQQVRKTVAGGETAKSGVGDLRPVRAKIRRPDNS